MLQRLSGVKLVSFLPFLVLLFVLNVSIVWIANSRLPAQQPAGDCGGAGQANSGSGSSLAALSSISRLHAVYSVNKAPSPKYLLVFDIWYHEQLTQFKVVIRQMAKLAALTNRILVLPYVAKSHIWGPTALMRDDFKNRNLYPFNYYFEIVDAKQYVPNGIIQMDEYLARTGANREAVALHTVCYGNGCGKEFSVITCPTDGFQAENNARQLTMGFIRLNRTMCLKIEDWNTDPVVDLLTTGALAQQDVVWTHYHKFLMRWDKLPPILRLSPFLEDEGKRFRASELEGTFLAIHWRFEKTIPENIPEIMPALLRTIDANMKTGKYKSIFLATEYATGGSDSWSEAQRKQKRPFYDQLLRHLREEQNYHVYEGYSSKAITDEGAVALLDQYLCLEGDLFIPVDYASSFTRDIVERREQAGKPNDKAVFRNYEWKIDKQGQEALARAYAN